MTDKELLNNLDELFDKWCDGCDPEHEDYELMDSICSELRKRIGVL